MNRIINYFNNTNNSSSKVANTKSLKFNLFKRKKTTDPCAIMSTVNNIDYSFTSMSNSSSLFTLSTVSDFSILNKSVFVQDSTLESATLEEMYSDNTNVLASQFSIDSNGVKLLSYTNDSSQITVKNQWTIDSINNSDLTIRSKLAELKATAKQLNIALPAHITMLETIYNLRMNSLTQEYAINQKKYEQKRHVNVIVKHFINASKLIKNSSLHWTKSFDVVNKNKIKHDDLENQIKLQIDSIQNELLTTICEIELKFKKEQNKSSIYKQRINYWTEVSMQKRIRNRKRLHKSVHVTSSSELRAKHKLTNLTLNE